VSIVFEHLPRFVASCINRCANTRIRANLSSSRSPKPATLDALEVLLRRYYRPLRAFITPMVGSSHADDVLQEIALAIFQNLRYLREPGAFRSWAFRLASRRAFRHLKRETRWKLLETDPDLISSLPAPEPLPEALEPALVRRFGLPSVLPVLSWASSAPSSS